MSEIAYFLGVDVGTQGIRVVLLDLQGELVFEEGNVFEISDSSREEQSPLEWWACCEALLRQMVTSLKGTINLNAIKAIGVTSTSGTMIPLDADNQPLHNALMYSDKRADEVGKTCIEAFKAHHNKGFGGFNSSSGLAKMVWFAKTYPEKASRLAKWIHAADFITGKLSCKWGVTDYTNAFKTGYDVSALNWPAYISDELGVKKEWLPEVLASGAVLGSLNKALADDLGLNPEILVTVGLTDGCASQIAAGAIKPGDWNTTIGTTLVLKGVTQTEIIDPLGRIYSHRHAMGNFWMPGGASNTGADWVSTQFEKSDLATLNEVAGQIIPTGKIVYPLLQKGERFPILAPQAYGFGTDGLDQDTIFAASMEGVAFLERYAYELAEELSGEKVSIVYTAGGASNSDVWLKIRSSVLNKKIVKMKYVSGGVGAAILAASKTHFNNIIDAVAQLTVIEKEVEPEANLVLAYDELYRSFLQEFVKRGFITKEEIYA